jgi:hypothetical protein
MESDSSTGKPSLNAEEISEGIRDRLEKYKSFNILEHFAMFMGMAQVLEFGLKRLLSDRYGVELERIEKSTMGQTVRQLKDGGLRPDYIALLESVVEYRNYMAHEFLANDAMLRQLLGGGSGRLEIRNLEKGTIELEQAIFLYDWSNQHNAW